MNTMYHVGKSCVLLAFTSYDFIRSDNEFNLFMNGLGYPNKRNFRFLNYECMDAFKKLCEQFNIKFEYILDGDVTGEVCD